MTKKSCFWVIINDQECWGLCLGITPRDFKNWDNTRNIVT